MKPLSFKEFEEDILEITSEVVERYNLKINHLDEYQIYASNEKSAFWFYHEAIYTLNMIFVDVKTDEKTPFYKLFEIKNIKNLYPKKPEPKCLEEIQKKRPKMDMANYYYSDICIIKEMCHLLLEHFSREFSTSEIS